MNYRTRRRRRDTAAFASAGLAFDAGTLTWARDFGDEVGEWVVAIDDDTGYFAGFVSRGREGAEERRAVFPTADAAVAHLWKLGLPA